MSRATDLPVLPEDIARMLAVRTPEERRMLFKTLRHEFPIHKLEKQLNTSAEVILEAISRASDLTLRGIRGIIAEAAFKQDIIVPFTSNSSAWKEINHTGDQSFDFALNDGSGPVTIQVKMQRQKEQRPMLASEASKKMFAMLTDYYVVETQRTRGGKDKDGKATRPYKFGEFDILAVALHPSTGNWSDFRYTVERWLVPTPGTPGEIFKYQPVPMAPDDCWTNDLATVIKWFRSDRRQQLPCAR